MVSLRKIHQYIVINFTRFITKKNVVFYCGSSFHIPHVESVISRFSDTSSCRIFLVCPVPFDASQLPGVTCLTSTLENIPKHIVIDLLVSSEAMLLPYYFCGKAVYFGHGIGPKMNYQLNSNIEKYDCIFSPCGYFYDEFCKILPSAKVEPIGLPILDTKVDKPDKKIILYAPSWCIDERYISDIHEVVKQLSQLNEYRVIVSLHPNLIRDSIVDFESADFNNSECEYLHQTEFKDSFDALKAANIVIGDISSIIFEALAFDIHIVFDGNTAIYEYCQSMSILNQVQDCFYGLEDMSSNRKTDLLISEDKKRLQRQAFASDYLLNQGYATDTFVQKLEAML